ncbi:MAG: type II toxin-antitoxin system HicA family toxin [Nitrospirae bacterium]|uniref:type II toxin-antitoxin system HicA family toxin n=1 Tax=Candidatus Magnetobacterium casense TaxID=1455061 RepID=UPI00058AFDA5|nr:type II toxin-antitoxin system HicA family toxin [Candidatus Magnetobacterium casensis]MBF0336315.1 type II toxin-antitoxin system HicA family toxin [Nitrospirota bacterium]
MGKVPPLSGKELCRVLEREGFKSVRHTGSHKIYQKPTEDGTITIPVPIHSNRPLRKGTLSNILKKAGITSEKLLLLLSLLLG